MEGEKLKPCPFCGSEPSVETPYDVCCSNSECECSYVVMDIDAWNRRAPDPLVGELVALTQMVLAVGTVFDDDTPDQPSVIYGHPNQKQWVAIFLKAKALAKAVK